MKIRIYFIFRTFGPKNDVKVLFISGEEFSGLVVPYFAPSVAVAVTQLLWRPRGLLVDQFDSKEDLINAVFTSSFIPG